VVGRAAYYTAGLFDRRLVCLRRHCRDELDRSRGNGRDNLCYGLRLRQHDQVCKAQSAVVHCTRGGHHHDVAAAQASLVRGVSSLDWHHHLLRTWHRTHRTRHPPLPIGLAPCAPQWRVRVSRDFDRQQERGGGGGERGGGRGGGESRAVAVPHASGCWC
jgi:hypothetical protein